MTRVSCQKIWGSIPGSPKWSDDSWRLCICKVTHPRPLPKGGESEQRAIHAGFYIPYFTYSTTTPFCFQGREERTEGNPCRILYSLLHIFNNNAFLFPREGRANRGQSTQDFIFLTSHIQQQRLFVSKGGKDEQRAFHADLYIIYFSFLTNNASCFQGRGGWTESNPCEPLRSLLLTLNKQQSPVSKGRENEQRAIHASFHIIYFSFSTSNDLLFAREEKLLRGYWYGNMNGLADWSHIEQPCNLRQITV